MICDRPELSVNGVHISPSRGNCTTQYNIVYLFICTLCDKPYVGRTVNPLINVRTNQHRSAFYRVLSAHKNGKLANSDLELDNESDDIYSLGMHIVIDHNLSEKGDFDKFYRVLILSSNSSPSSLEVKEHKFIHRLKSLRPSGINRANPFSIPPLNLIFTNPSAIQFIYFLYTYSYFTFSFVLIFFLHCLGFFLILRGVIIPTLPCNLSHVRY